MDKISDGLKMLVKRGGAPALVNDDNGKWTVLFNGMQPVEGGPGHYCWIIDYDTKWHKTPLKAVVAALNDI